MFIDPHLDPMKPGYRDFGELLRRIGKRTQLVEIHRRVPQYQARREFEVNSTLSQATDQRRVPIYQDRREFESQFRSALVAPLRTADLHATVFLWGTGTWARFHDRYLISNLVGICLPDGFDTGKGRTTWTRLGRDDRDDIQREFDPATARHRVSSFRIP